MKVLIIVPAHNEEENLPALLEEIKNEGYDAVVVDDASTDNSADVARAASIPVLSLPVNLGIGGGVQTGFLYAVRNRYDIAVQVDGDGQHSTEWISAILGPILADEADCVVGSRYVPDCPDEDYRTPFVRRMGMHFSTGILALFTGLRIHDTTSGFRALNRTAFTFFSTDYPVDHPEAESLLLLHQLGFRIKEVPVRMRCRTAGQSLFTMTKAALYPLRVIIGFMGLVFKKPTRKRI